VQNAGLDGGVIQHQVMDTQTAKKNTNIGYDVMSGQFVDMIKAGIIDPAKVTKGALANAASIAAMILTTEALIADLPEKNAPSMMGGMPDY
jgi:chaperonin GroEL